MREVDSNTCTRWGACAEVSSIYCVYVCEEVDRGDKDIDVGTIGDVEVILGEMFYSS